MLKTITVQDALKFPEKDVLFVDTRSPGEFAIDNIPGSINIPIFSNEERAIIGTLYKKDQDEAYKQGFAIYTQKVADFKEQFKAIPLEKKIIIYCWRGGMRSKTITELVTEFRKDVFQLVGGYKEFRKLVRNELQSYTPPFKLVVLQGMAGCGKTDIIKQISPSLDLEGLAHHRSSLFGALGLQPVTQKMFESRLYKRLQELKDESTVFIEGEAKKIGDLFVPDKLFQVMQDAPTVLITATIENRSKRIVRDYFTHNEDEKIKEIIKKLKVHLTNKVVDELLELVDNKAYEQVAKVLLEDYYDKQYAHALKDKKYIKEISSDNLNIACVQLHEIKNNLS